MLEPEATKKLPPSLDELAQNFATPPKAYSPVPIWWWSGDTLTRERLRWQMEQLVAGGVYNAVVLNLAPTGPLYGSDPDDPPFLSEAWWTLFEGVCKDAEALGFHLWFYDQLGFSGANLQAELVRGDPRFSGESLESLSADGTNLSLTCPSEGQPLAAFFTTETGATRIALEGRTAHITAKEAGRLRLIYSVRRGFDYFNPEACQTLLDTVHGAFERRMGRFFGTAIVGSFQDELPNLATWSAGFAEAFAQRKGYSLSENLISLWEGTDDQAEHVRADYQEVRGSLAEDAFFKPLFAWHERHGLICGFDQQGPARAGEPLGTVKLYADYLRTHRWFSAPGSDHHGDSKIHSSLAHLYDRERVWIESFHSSGWGGTLEETFDWLLPWLGAGATLYDPHAVYYSTWGGWWEWAPPSTCWRQPYWRHYPVFAAAVSRLSYLLSQGRHVCDIGVLHPTTTVQANLTAEGQPLAPQLTEEGISANSKSSKRTTINRAQLANYVYEEIVGSMMFLASEAGVLRGDRRDFDVLDDASMQRGRVAGGRLEIADERFRVIVLPACSTLQAATAEKLIAFAQEGGTLIAVSERPRHVLGSPEALERLTVLFDQGKATLILDADDLPHQLERLERRVEAPVPVLHRRIGEHEVLFVPAAFPHASQSEDESASWLSADYSFAPERYTPTMDLTVKGFSGTPELWDALSGERVPVAHTRDSDRTVLTVPFDRSPAALLVWSDADETIPVPEETHETVLQTLPDIWQFSLESTLDNRYGDFDKPHFEGAPPVQTWAFAHSVGENASDKTVQATFGCYGVWTGPEAESRLPEPAVGVTTPLAEGWREAVYSLERGIYKDALHVPTLGPKGHVPEEFLAFGEVAAGQGVQYRTALHLEHETALYLALGAAAHKRAWLNGSELQEDEGGYLQFYPVTLEAGANMLEFRLTAETATELRAYFALVKNLDAFSRPERMTLSDTPQKDSRVVFSHTFEVPFMPSSLRVQIAADATCAVRLNGHELGRQGGFDPYYSLARVQPYATERVVRGKNTLEVELQDTGRPFSVLVDGLVGVMGGTKSFVSGKPWRVKRDDGEVQPVTLVRQPLGDPAFALLKRRPPPLPGTMWLEGHPADETVLALVPDAQSRNVTSERFHWTLPVGATQLHLVVAGQVHVWVDGEELLESGNGSGFALPDAGSPHRTALMEVIPERGRTGGGVFRGPVTYDVSSGTIRLGAWAEQGLETYSGGVRYEITFSLGTLPNAPLNLDLGRVRGTAEVWLNAQLVGVRIFSPYRFDLTPFATAGENRLEVLILNTLAPYLNAVSPTHYVRPGQAVSGLFGPVRLLTLKEGSL